MKKLLLAALWLPLMAHAQSYPSPTYNNVTVQGTLTGKVNSTGSTITNATITGGTISGLSSPLPVASGGTNSASASGTALDNITGFSGTGFMSRTGAGAYSFTASTGSGSVVLGTSPSIATPTITGSFTATGLVTLADLATQAANTVLANVTGSTASPTAFAMPGCSAATNALTWTSGTGFTCNSAVNAATLGGATFAAPGPIGSTTASTGAFTTLSSSSGLTVSAGGAAITGASSFATAVTAPTLALGTNTTGVATSAFVATRDLCRNIMDYGGNNGGSTDNSVAWTSVISAQASSSNACVYFPPGVFYFTSTPTFTTQNHGSITIMGAGVDVTQLKFSSGTNGPTITYYSGDSSSSVHDLTIMTAGANNATGLTLTAATGTYGTGQNAQSNIFNVTIRGADGYAVTDYWANGVYVSSVRWINFLNVLVEGGGGCSAVSGYGCYSTNTANGFNLQGTASLIPVQFNFVNCGANYVNNGIVYGNYVQGVIVQNSEFVGGKYGIYVPTSTTGPDQLTVQGSNFNVYPQGIYTGVGVSNTSIVNNTFLVPPSSQGIDMLASDGFSIVGNVFQSVQGTPQINDGIVIEGSTLGGIITGNYFLEFNGGIWLKAGTGGVNVQSNSYYSNSSNVINSSSAACPATTSANCVGGGSQ